MVKGLIINKSTDIKSFNIKNIDDFEEELYKKAGLKKKDDFKQQHLWKCKNSKNSYQIVLYGKTVGRSGNENKFEFPPPIDNVVYFGSCILIKKENDVLKDLTEEEWNVSYEKFYGGFEDLNKTELEDEEEEDELEKYPSNLKTSKTGYLKDGFVIDDEDENIMQEENDDENNSNDEEELDNDLDNENALSSNEEEDLDEDDNDEDDEITDNSSELVEEPYYFTDDDFD